MSKTGRTAFSSKSFAAAAFVALALTALIGQASDWMTLLNAKLLDAEWEAGAQFDGSPAAVFVNGDALLTCEPHGTQAERHYGRLPERNARSREFEEHVERRHHALDLRQHRGGVFGRAGDQV